MDEAYIAEIAEQAAALAGCGTAQAKPMAAAACARIRSLLKSGVEPETCRAELVSAGTLWTLSLLAAAGTGTDVSAYSAGDVRVQRRSASEAAAGAAALRRQAEDILAPYLKSGFAFVGVDG